MIDTCKKHVYNISKNRLYFFATTQIVKKHLLDYSWRCYMAYSYKEVVKILKENGWQLKRTSGSHEIYVSTEGKTCPIK